jgi:apolipoprotein N-acyltransferase
MSLPQSPTPEARRPFPWIIGLIFALCSGALLFASFPPYDKGIAIWVALVPLLIPLWSGAPRTGWKGALICGLYGWVAGVAFFGSSFWWINEVSTLGFIPLTMYLALYPALWAALLGTVLRPRFKREPEPTADREENKAHWRHWCTQDIGITIKAVLVGASLWVCTEWLRGWVMTGFGWNGMGVALYQGLTFAQLAAWVGTTALSFIPAAVNIWIWCVGRRLGIMVIREGRRSVPWDFFVMTFGLVVLFLWGNLEAVRYAPGNQSQVTLPVLAIQRNMSQDYKWNRANVDRIYTELAQSTEEACNELQLKSIADAEANPATTFGELPTWVIWPESSLPTSTIISAQTGELFKAQGREQYNEWFLGADGPMRAVRNNVPIDFVLLTGADEVHWDAANNKTSVYNTLMALPGDFDTRLTHAKSHLVPFGEYIPLRETFPILEKAFEFSAGMAMGSNFSSGTSYEPLRLPIVPGSVVTVDAIPTICFEDSVGRLVRRFARPERQVIVNVTNDGWFNHSWANEQHLRNAIFRSIELRRSMIRAANTGITVAIAPNGAIIKELRDAKGSPFIADKLFARLPITDTSLTLYAMAGDWAVLVCALIVIGVLSIRIARKRAKLTK